VDLRQINRRGLECLIKVGALDDFGERYRILAAIDQLMQVSTSAHEAADVGQLTLFGEVESATDAEILSGAGPVAKVSNKEVLEWEKELVGVYVSSHPLQQMTVDLMNVVTHATVDITEELGKQSVVIAGLLAEVRTFTTKKGEQMAFCRLEDLQGSVDVTVFPQLFREKKDLWKQDKIIIVWGKADPRNGRMSVVADRVQDYVQGQRVIEDTETVYHRYQNGGGQPARPVMRGTDSNGRTISPVPTPTPRYTGQIPAVGGDEDDVDYAEANPFADEAPDWLMSAANGFEPGPTQVTGGPTSSVTLQVPSERPPANGSDHTPKAEPPEPSARITEPLPTAALERPESRPATPTPPPAPEPVPEGPVRYGDSRPQSQAVRESPGHVPAPQPQLQRLTLTFQRSHSLDADRKRLSDLVDLLEKYEGTDRFAIVVEATGQPRYQLEFPNSYTRICKELTNELSLRLGPKRWRLE
jgi:DNA polymerase-3 subunit alpha